MNTIVWAPVTFMGLGSYVGGSKMAVRAATRSI